MREGVEVRLRPGDRERLDGVAANRKSPQHHVWQARIVLMTTDGAGTVTIRAVMPRLSNSSRNLALS
jgi:hypothetical protein